MQPAHKNTTGTTRITVIIGKDRCLWWLKVGFRTVYWLQHSHYQYGCKHLHGKVCRMQQEIRFAAYNPCQRVVLVLLQSRNPRRETCGWHFLSTKFPLNETELKKVGRPPKINPTVFRCSVNFNAAEQSALQTIHEKSGIDSLSAFVKMRIFGKLSRLFRWTATHVSSLTSCHPSTPVIVQWR